MRGSCLSTAVGASCRLALLPNMSNAISVADEPVAHGPGGRSAPLVPGSTGEEMRMGERGVGAFRWHLRVLWLLKSCD